MFAECFDCYIAGPKMRLILIRKCSIKETPEIFKELEHMKNIVLIVYFFLQKAVTFLTLLIYNVPFKLWTFAF